MNRWYQKKKTTQLYKKYTMSFLAGFLFIIALLMTTIVVLFLANFLPKEMVFVPVIFMIGLDAILVGSYFYIMIDGFIEDETKFRYGLAASFALSAFGRAFYLMVKTLKEEKVKISL